MSGGYAREATARAVGEYYPRNESDRPGASVSSLDLDRGWATLSSEAWLMLNIYRRQGEEPPSEDPMVVRAELIRLQEAEKNLHRQRVLILRLRRILAVHQLGKGMAVPETRDRIVLTGVGAGRGQCDICGRLLEHGRAWRDSGRDLRWCAEHGRDAAA